MVKNAIKFSPCSLYTHEILDQFLKMSRYKKLKYKKIKARGKLPREASEISSSFLPLEL